jgi:hypothetical protein
MPTGTVLAYSIPDGADVYIDNIKVFTRFGSARTPALIPEVSAGTHDITFRLYGYAENTISARIHQGGYTTITGILNREKKSSI